MTNKAELIAVLENPNYIMNIGNVIRNINALGVDRLLVVDGQNRLEQDLDELRQRKSLLKHSNGAVKWTNIKVFKDVNSCFSYLNDEGFTSIGTSPHDICKKQVKINESDLTIPRLAIWFGEEANGLSPMVVNKFEYCLCIEMRGKVESLNLSTTTAIVMYEAIRQRK